MQLIFITNQPQTAQVVQEAGIDRVMVDLEIIGKEARQGHLNTVISRHSPNDISALRPVLTHTELMVRINPLHDGTKAEVDDTLARGAERLMLPMFRHPDEARRFIDIVASRAKVSLLVETASAAARLRAIAALDGVDDIHIGLNDLHLELKLDFMFEILSEGLIESLAQTLRLAGQFFGIGGIGPMGAGLMLPAELILAAHLRLGSRQVILSRDFGALLTEPKGAENFIVAVHKLREQNATFDAASDLEFEERELCRIVRNIVSAKRKKVT